jgi:exodeoxyribonuclease VII large subunit
MMKFMAGPVEQPGSSNRQILSVSEINRSARRILEGEFPMVFVEGEISNFMCPSSGHWYMTLKDEKAQLRCAMFVNRNRLVRFAPRNGSQVIIRGRISIYEGRGEFQLIAEFMEEAGDGALRAAFEKLKANLEAEGLFAEEAKQPIPTLPGHIGVITSPTGAAVRDILHVLNRRFPSIPVSVIPVQVQGEESVPQVVDAIDFANRHKSDPFDVIILARGGGSLEDLWSFNTEQVARAIHHSEIPIISAIGHETDFTIADFVADVRAPTPSAAAEIVSPSQTDWLASFQRSEVALAGAMLNQLRQLDTHLGHVRRRLRHPGSRLQDLYQRLDGLEIRLRSSIRSRLERASSRTSLAASRLDNPAARIQGESARVTFLADRLSRGMNATLRDKSHRLSSFGGRLTSASPEAILDRGYAILLLGDRIVTSAAEVEPGDTIVARLKHGQVTADVTATELPDDEPG